MSADSTWLHRVLAGAALILLLAPGAAVVAAGSGGGGMGAPMSSAPQSPERQAERQYELGLKYKRRAWRYEAQAAEAADDAKRDKLIGKARRQYEKAVKAFGQAVALNNDYTEALNELGYAYRKSGDFVRAIAAYNAALKLRPDFAEAIEYRGEALLSLQRFDDVKTHYLWLFQNSPELAAQLLDAMRAWLQANPADGDGADARAAFASWVDERAALAAQHSSLSLNSTRRWD